MNRFCLVFIATVVSAAPLVRLQQHTLRAKVPHDASMAMAVDADGSFLELVASHDNQFQLIRLRNWWQFIPDEESLAINDLGGDAAPRLFVTVDGNYAVAIGGRTTVIDLRELKVVEKPAGMGDTFPTEATAPPRGLPIGCTTFETSRDHLYIRAICEKIQIGALRHRVSERRHEVFTIPTIRSAGFVDDAANHPTKALLSQHGLQHYLLTVKDGKILSVYLIPVK